MSYAEHKKSTGIAGTSQAAGLPATNPLNVLPIAFEFDFACFEALSIVKTSYSEILLR